MSHSKKDGRRGGAHRNTQGREYWSPRKPGMLTPGRIAKNITHAKERAAQKALLATNPDALEVRGRGMSKPR